MIVFTASQQEYADSILNFLDPWYELIEHRLYRDSWYTTFDQTFIKDLRIFEDQWDLKDIVLIDNSTYSFWAQISNGVPILSFIYGKDDFEMIYLSYFLNRISREYDLRTKIWDTFWLQRLKIPFVWDSISGVIEYIIEEIPEDLENHSNLIEEKDFKYNKSINSNFHNYQNNNK